MATLFLLALQAIDAACVRRANGRARRCSRALWCLVLVSCTCSGLRADALAAQPSPSDDSNWADPPVPTADNTPDESALDTESASLPLDADDEPEPLMTGEPPALSAANSECADNDDVWLVDTRAVGCGCHPELLRYWQRESCWWRLRSNEEFLATQKTWLPTVFFIHGNSMTAEDARHAGWVVYQRICRGVKQPVRFVIWSWPSNRMTVRTVRDVRMKAELSDQQGFYLAWLLARMTPDPSTSVIGYSYGTRVVSSGLHQLAGGIVACRRLNEPPSEGAQVRLCLMAAAQDFNGFEPGGDYARALTQASELVVLRNRCDGVLRFYTGLEHLHGPPALGVVGLYPSRVVAEQPVKIQQLDVQPYVGARHSLQYYLESPAVTARLRRFVREAYSVSE